jgi:hypothetical protein
VKNKENIQNVLPTIRKTDYLRQTCLDVSVQEKILRPRKPKINKCHDIDECTPPKVSSILNCQQAKTKSRGGCGSGVSPQDRNDQKLLNTNARGVIKLRYLKDVNKLPVLQHPSENGCVTNVNILEDRARKLPFDTHVDNKLTRRRYFNP